jgi:quinol-cytochrome oxidoreductase complex cytochrome b subunit
MKGPEGITKKAWIGKSILAIGILHIIVGIIVFHDVLALLVSEKLVNTITLRQQPDRAEAFWFLLTGFALLIVGGLVDWIERNGVNAPAFLPWSFLSIIVVIGLMMPISGVWLFIVPTVGLFRGRRLTRGID